MPTVPLHSRASTRLQVTPAVASVSPQPSMIGQPVRASQRSATARCTAMPPLLATSQAGEIDAVEAGMVQERVVERVHRREEVRRMAPQVAHERRRGRAGWG